MSIMPNPITADLMRIQDKEWAERLKSALHGTKKRKKKGRERSMQSGAVCKKPAVSVR